MGLNIQILFYFFLTYVQPQKIKHCTTEVKQKLHFVDKIQNATPEPDPPKKKSTY